MDRRVEYPAEGNIKINKITVLVAEIISDSIK